MLRRPPVGTARPLEEPQEASESQKEPEEPLEESGASPEPAESLAESEEESRSRESEALLELLQWVEEREAELKELERQTASGNILTLQRQQVTTETEGGGHYTYSAHPPARSDRYVHTYLRHYPVYMSARYE